MNKILQFVTVILLLNTQISQAITCSIKGTLIDRSDKEIVIMPFYENSRFKGVVIPISNNSFYYTFDSNNIEKFKLLSNVDFKEFEFFNDTSIVELKITPNSFEVNGGNVNKKMTHYNLLNTSKFSFKEQVLNNKKDSLINTGTYYNANYISLLQKVKQANNKEERIEFAMQLETLEPKFKL